MARAAADRQLAPAASRTCDGIAVATRDDDADLRALLRRVETPGSVGVAFTREPDYFRGEGLAGALDQTVVFRTEGALSGMARLSIQSLHRNGLPQSIGYLGELRLAPEAPRRPRILRDGFELLRSAVVEHGVSGCYTSIAADNARARSVLEHGRRLGLPSYLPLAELVTLLVPVGRSGRAARPEPRGASVDRDELTSFLARHAGEAQLAPTWDAARWDSLACHGMDMNDFVVVRERDNIVGAAALWDQRAVRQTVIMGYRGMLRLARPLVNVFASVGLAPSLPAPGHVLPLAAVLGATVSEDRQWAPLWRALRDSARARDLGWLSIARGADDPQLAVLRDVAGGREYRTRLYDVRWPGTPTWSDAWHALPFRPEVALL